MIITPETFLAIFLIFCRIGGCLLIAPGFSSARVSPQIRLFIAIMVTLAITPMIVDKFPADSMKQNPAMTLAWIISESLTGFLIGLLGRIFFMALQTMATAVAMAAGFGSIPGTPMDEAEPLPAMSSVITMVATALIFMSDLHWEVFRGLAASYSRIPPGEGIGTQLALIQITDQISSAFLLSLRISSPFIVYSIVVNLAVGITNKLTPQIPVYFLATPFIMLGGLLLLYFLFNEFMFIFMGSFASWLTNG